MTLCVIGADIPADASVVLASDGKIYPAGEYSGEFVGRAVESMREGFRAMIWNGECREDDA